MKKIDTTDFKEQGFNDGTEFFEIDILKVV